jgi:FKBP-type peptidyl-prolyl cis-trans isomerase SlpA
MTKVLNNSRVVLHYTGKLETGEIFDSTLDEGRDPFDVKLGQGQLIKGFENGLIDMVVGEKKTIEIEPNSAYGEVKEELILEVPIDRVPEGITVGAQLQSIGENGQPINVEVVEVNEKTVKLDANHPLAGKKLLFEIELLEIS